MKLFAFKIDKLKSTIYFATFTAWFYKDLDFKVFNKNCSSFIVFFFLNFFNILFVTIIIIRSGLIEWDSVSFFFFFMEMPYVA